MTPRSTPACAHERRPGTTVCLRCRHEELLATRERRRKTGLRLMVRAGGAAAVVALLVAAAGALRPGESTVTDDQPVVATPEPAVEPSFAVTQSGEVARPAARVTPAPRTIAPAIPTGQRTDLGAGLYAERTGDTVIVHFDTQDFRTRRSDKFEHVVRTTLPAVFGDAGKKAVDGLATGALVPAGQLLTVLDSAPLVVPVGDGRVVRLQPQARQGRDGPLVVTYRAVIESATAPSAS